MPISATSLLSLMVVIIIKMMMVMEYLIIGIWRKKKIVMGDD